MLRFIGRAHGGVVKLLGLTALTVILLSAMCRFPVSQAPNTPATPPIVSAGADARRLGGGRDRDSKVVSTISRVAPAGFTVNTYIPAVSVQPTPSPPATMPPVPTVPAFLVRCLDVPPDKIDGIATGLTVTGGGQLNKATAQAVKSNHFAEVYFIAAVIDGPGMGDLGQIGIWASNRLEVAPRGLPGLIFSADAFAREFSDWGDGAKTTYQLSAYDDGGQEAKSCVEYRRSH